MVNTLKLKAKLVEKGFTQAETAKKINISAHAFFQKLHNKSDFTIAEYENLCRLLKLSEKESKEIFFN